MGLERKENKLVVRVGKVTPMLAKLALQCRSLFEPHVSSKLREETRWRVKDYVQFGRHFSVSHVLAFSQTKLFTNLKVIGLERGAATFHFRVTGYALASAIHAGGVSRHILSQGSIVLPYEIEPSDPMWRMIEGLRRTCKVTHSTSRVVVVRKRGDAQYSIVHYRLEKEERGDAIKIGLKEIGPRMDLELIKVEEGVCSGEVTFHAYIVKSEEEKADLEKRIRERREQKERRREAQERNVELKRKSRERKSHATSVAEEKTSATDGDSESTDYLSS